MKTFLAIAATTVALIGTGLSANAQIIRYERAHHHLIVRHDTGRQQMYDGTANGGNAPIPQYRGRVDSHQQY